MGLPDIKSKSGETGSREYNVKETFSRNKPNTRVEV